MKFVLFLFLPLFVKGVELVQMPGGSLRTPDVEISRIYPDSNPLNLVYIHSYNPLHNCAIGIKTSEIESPFEVKTDSEFFLIVNRPITNSEPLLLRPHYWASKDSGGIINVNVKVRVVSAQGNVLLDGNHNVNAHDLVCSPSNMGLFLDMAPERSHLLYSEVEMPLGKKAITCHWIPNEDQWEDIWQSEFLSTPSPNTDILSERVSCMFSGDPHWEIVRKILSHH